MSEAQIFTQRANFSRGFHAVRVYHVNRSFEIKGVDGESFPDVFPDGFTDIPGALYRRFTDSVSGLYRHIMYFPSGFLQHFTASHNHLWRRIMAFGS